MHTYLPIEKLFSLGQLVHYALENTVNYGEPKTRFSQYYLFLLWAAPLLCKTTPSEQQNFSFFLAFSQSTHDQEQLGSVTQAEANATVLHTLLQYLLGCLTDWVAKHREMALTKFSGTCPSLISVNRTGRSRIY